MKKFMFCFSLEIFPVESLFLDSTRFDSIPLGNQMLLSSFGKMHFVNFAEKQKEKKITRPNECSVHALHFIRLLFLVDLHRTKARNDRFALYPKRSAEKQKAKENA